LVKIMLSGRANSNSRCWPSQSARVYKESTKSRGSVLEVIAKSGGAAEDIRFETSPQQRKALSFLRTFGSTQTQNQ